MNQQSSPDGEGGYKRALDFNEALMSNSSYADDSMFMMMRYAYKTKNLLRQCDAELFNKKITQMVNLLDGEPPQGEETSEERAVKVREKRQEALALVTEFPELTAEFDQFVEAVRRFRATMKK